MEQIDRVLNETFDRAYRFASSNLTIGEKIQVDGITVVPISIVNAGSVASAGQSKFRKKTKMQSFGGGTDGGGLGVRIKPIGFLVIENGKSRFISCEQNENEDVMQSVLNAVLKKITGLKL